MSKKKRRRKEGLGVEFGQEAIFGLITNELDPGKIELGTGCEVEFKLLRI